MTAKQSPRPVKKSIEPPFDYSLDFATIDFRERPDLYRVGKGEQGVLSVEPYKSEILHHWRFKTPAIARESADTIWAMFEAYRERGDFVGMDMARKFLQMGVTRSRRYANHKSGRKWSPDHSEVLPPDIDPVKAECARIFFERYERARDDETYQRMRAAHIEASGKRHP
ncbi:MAG: DUF4385 domain-containing protein [Chloroflexia bacterium]|nr:DUF4385 domain-containing protein [Chloroflexia bacterium]